MAKQRPRRRAIRPGAAKLRQFLDTHELSYTSAGGELGVSAVTVWDWARGNKIPNADHREILATWTQDAVWRLSVWSTVGRTIVSLWCRFTKRTWVSS